MDDFLAQPAVEVVLEAPGGPGSTAADPWIAGHLDLAGADPALPERIGSFSILERLGEGGMGTVYLGEQTEPVQRRVALKVIRILESPRLRRRFAVEGRALARLGHPCIATLHEVGTAEATCGVHK